MDCEMIEEIARAIHRARFMAPGREREPTPMGFSDEEYCGRLAQAAYSVMAGRIEELEDTLTAIDKSAFIGVTTDSDETRRVALDSIHDIARSTLSPSTEEEVRAALPSTPSKEPQ